MILIMEIFYVAFLLLLTGTVCFTDTGRAFNNSHGGFEHRVFERIISMAEKYLDFLRDTRRTPAVGSCLPGFVRHQEHCYKVFDVKATWDAARQFCAALDTDLATIDNQKTQEFLKSQLTKGTYKQPSFWAGGTDVQTEGKWLWMHRHDKTQPFSGYTAWGPKELNGGRSENCMGLHKGYDWKWCDVGCSIEFGFICQGP